MGEGYCLDWGSSQVWALRELPKHLIYTKRGHSPVIPMKRESYSTGYKGKDMYVMRLKHMINLKPVGYLKQGKWTAKP
jgi:hypothetical protein